MRPDLGVFTRLPAAQGDDGVRHAAGKERIGGLLGVGDGRDRNAGERGGSDSLGVM